MHALQFVENVSQKYGVPLEDLIRLGTELALKERKKGYLRERLEILSRYGVTNVQELEGRIQRGEVSDHPAWEDIIEVKNIEVEVKEIERDLGSLQAA